MTTRDGEEYQRGVDDLAASGVDVHGEADLVAALEPATVLDAGCGTGRVAVELHRRGIDVTGVDVDPSMLATARGAGPGISWVECDLAALDLGRAFDVVVMAGNVPLSTGHGTQEALVAAVAGHVAADGHLVCGFQLGRGYDLDDYDEHCAAAGLELVRRYATWNRHPFDSRADYAVSIHRPA